MKNNYLPEIICVLTIAVMVWMFNLVNNKLTEINEERKKKDAEQVVLVCNDREVATGNRSYFSTPYRQESWDVPGGTYLPKEGELCLLKNVE